MADLFSSMFGQIPQLSQTLTVGPPDILGNMTISGLNGTVGTIATGVFGEQQLQVGGETVATIQDSVFGNYQITTDEGTFTAIDSAAGGESLLHFGEVVAVSRPGLFGEENWYDAGTNELLATTGANGFGQTTITIPSNFDSSSFDVLGGLDTFSMGSDFADFGDVFASSSDFLDFLDFI
jgi:hypothetical protein